MADAYGVDVTGLSSSVVDVHPAPHVASMASCAVSDTVWWRCPRAASAVPATPRSSAAGPALVYFFWREGHLACVRS